MSWNTHIPKFRRFVLQNFPFIEEDFDALTDYELICKVIEYLNKVITSQNGVVAEVETLEGLFNDLKSFVDNYFDNLDVQEEINNKLEQMAEDGTLQEIITTYIQSNVAWTFDSVADMKAATNLVDGSYARTLGFYSDEDGGGALYKITDTGTANEIDVIAVGDGLYAHIVLDTEVNVKQFGAKGDGTTDDTDSIQTALDTRKKVIFPATQYKYAISEKLSVYNDIQFFGGIKMLNTDGTANKSCLLIQDYQEDKILHIINPIINGNRNTEISYPTDGYSEFSYGIDIKGSKNIVIDGGSIINCQGDSICISKSNTNSYSENIEINNVYCDYPYRNCLSIVSGSNIRINNCKMYNRNGYRCCLVEPNPDNTLRNDGIVYDGGYYYSDHGHVMASYASRDIKDITYRNLTIEQSANSLCSIHASQPSGNTYQLQNMNINNVTIISNNDISEMPVRVAKNLQIDGFNITHKFKYISFIANTANVCNVHIDIDPTVENVGSFTIRASYINLNNSRFNYNNITSSGSPCVALIDPVNVLVDSNMFLNNKNSLSISQPSNTTTVVDTAIITNNIFTEIDTSTRNALTILGGATVNTLIFTDNLRGTNVSRTLYILNGTVNRGIGNNITKGSTYYDTAIPVSGDYDKGDMIINSSPSAGAAFGWVCTVAGNPGTWKAISTIEA